MKYLSDYFYGFDEEITRFQWPDSLTDINAAKDTLQDFLNEMECGETLFYAVLSADDAFVGSVEVHGLPDDTPELGVWIIAAQQGKGYAYEALRAVIQHVCAEYDKHEFYYEADIRNAASIKLLQKLRNDYDIKDLEPELMMTDSGKVLELQGHTIRIRSCIYKPAQGMPI